MGLLSLVCVTKNFSVILWVFDALRYQTPNEDSKKSMSKTFSKFLTIKKPKTQKRFPFISEYYYSIRLIIKEKSSTQKV